MDPWNAYAAFYDWENARTLGRADLPFWRRVIRSTDGRVLELGCGTGRLTMPLSRDAAAFVGIDRSEAMLARAERRVRARRRRGSSQAPSLALGDIRTLPFRRGSFAAVLAPYGVLQSLLTDRDLNATLASVADVLATHGIFGIDLVPDVPKWREYRNRVQMRGKAAGNVHLTLVESVRQDRARRQTVFEQRYLTSRGPSASLRAGPSASLRASPSTSLRAGPSASLRASRRVTEHAFELRFRTLPLPQMTKRLKRHGFAVEAVLGDYEGGPWQEEAEQWIILARRRPT